ncbi:ANTAR domain-containing protein [Streptomyces sp. NPDC088785]|uniref:ANTAR domain-containing protein n=1 Tax=Streptomyces sp. NPDC088785 TaxID=3365897 RepID=UPI003826DD77
MSTAARTRALEDEIVHLRRAITSHAVVDQAIGVVLATGHIEPAEAWDVLREISMHTNTKVRVVAEAIVGWARTGLLPTEIRTELEQQLCARQRFTAREAARTRERREPGP